MTDQSPSEEKATRLAEIDGAAAALDAAIRATNFAQRHLIDIVINAKARGIPLWEIMGILAKHGVERKV